MDEQTLRATIAQMMPQVREDLARLVSIPSIFFEGFPPEPVLSAAEATRDLLRSVGVADARLVDLPAGHPPAVVGSVPGPEGAPTVLLYAHYDVQPVGDEAAWVTPAFEPVERDGRLYGRGSADDKGGIVVHAAALRAFDGRPPVGVKIVIEGEEETGASALDDFIPAHPDLFSAQAILVADMGNEEVGTPTLTTSLRGITSVVVEVRTLQGEIHSGLFGGPAPDALMALIRMLATLHDDDGGCAVAGLASSEWEGADQAESEFRRLAGVVDGVDLTGSGTVGSRLWSKSAVNVIGIDAPAIHGSRNVLIDVARARVSLRVPPGQDARRAQALLAQHLEAVAPGHVQVAITLMETGPGIRVSSHGPAHAAMRRAMASAFGREPGEKGSGGSIPLIDVLARTFPAAEILMFGVEEPRTNIHAPNESVDLQELERVVLAESLMLAGLGGPNPSDGPTLGA
jgi:cysteinylglycine-S-conjugate dipeptidase